MYLKTLTLKGFKSFAETTVLDLEPGITVVVGPNGSGKSNVVDAVAWVLGAQGPSTVRSAKMEDVIFAGSGRRPALGRAEVSLTIDNSSGRLPVGLAEVTVTRTLWRSGESEYALNGAPCRLLDIQEMLSDSGVGRRQHVIVSQGQLEAVLNSRPEERRLIIEEAAGILKYRRRRERTERRIAATGGDLARLSDLVREVRSQLRPLERQAEAAQRHDTLVAEHRALRLYVAGRELSDASAALDAAQASRSGLSARCAALRGRLETLDEAVALAEAALGTQRVDEVDVLIGAAGALSERARGLAAVVEERRRSLGRSLASMVDEVAVAALEAEVVRVSAELADADAGAKRLGRELADLEVDEAALKAERVEASAPGGPPTSAGPGGGVTAAELRGRLGALRHSLDRDRQELARTEAGAGRLDRRRRELLDTLAEQAAAVAAGEEHEARTAEALAEAARVSVAADRAAELAEDAVRSGEAERDRWHARAEALAMALDQLRARGGAKHLAGSPGLIGTLAELVEVDHGWEAAFEAAVGDAAASAVLTGVPEAVEALGRLAAADVSGLVIAPIAVGDPTSPAAGELSAHVRASHAGVTDVLARLLEPVTFVEADWRTALELALAHPGTVVVTRAGDRFAPDGWRVGAPGLGPTGAALGEAEEAARQAGDRLATALSEREAAVSERERARRHEAELVAGRDANVARLARASLEASRAGSEWERAEAELRSAGEHVLLLRRQVERALADVAALEGRVVSVEAAESAEAERDRRRSEERRRLDARIAGLESRRRDIDVRSAGLDERRSMLASRLRDLQDRLARTVEARDEAAGGRQRLLLSLRVADRLATVVKGAQARIDAELADLREDRSARARLSEERASALGRLRAERMVLRTELEEATGVLHEQDIALAEVRLRHQGAVEAIRSGLAVEPEEALRAPRPDLAPGLAAAQRLSDLDRELRLAGPVNPLAVAELAALRERAELLDRQLGDIKAARRELTRVIHAIDTEMSAVFATAYADVSRHFTHLFATLFSGGEGALCLTDPEDLLETGVEVLARPAGKRVRSISLLSGGERSLVALAFLFAVFRSRPSPFYLLDEVEAALDDVNLQRFLDLIDEFRTEAQLIIVSHQRRTMEVADCLYGVSMQSGGSSRVVSERAPSPS